MSVLPTISILTPNLNTSSERTPEHHAAYVCALALYCFNLILSVFNFTFGIISWTMLPNWREFRHYVYMNLILASTVNMIGFNVHAHIKIADCRTADVVFVFIVLIPRVIMSHWLLVTTIMIYRDIVKGFNSELRRPYLVANVFSWLVPFVEVLFVYAIDCFFHLSIRVTLNYAMNMSLMVVSIIIYFVVVFNIIKLTLAQKGSGKEIVSKIIVATMCGIPSGLSTLMPILVMELTHGSMVLYNLMLIMCLISITAGHVVFMSLKANRNLWAEYMRKRRMINNL